MSRDALRKYRTFNGQDFELQTKDYISKSRANIQKRNLHGKNIKVRVVKAKGGLLIYAR